jgi:hypothetical protein
MADDNSVTVACQSHWPISLQVNDGLTSMRRVSIRAQARLEENGGMSQGEAMHDIVDVGTPSVSNRREHARHTLKIPLVGVLSSDQLRRAQDNDAILQAVKKLIESPEADNTAFVNLGAELVIAIPGSRIPVNYTIPKSRDCMPSIPVLSGLHNIQL